jgi:hypothetical protein
VRNCETAGYPAEPVRADPGLRVGPDLRWSGALGGVGPQDIGMGSLKT